MWPRGTKLQAYLWMLLLSTAFSLSNTTYSLASLCAKFAGRWETILETDTIIHLHDGAPSVKNCTLVVKTFLGSSIYVKLKYWTEPDLSPQCTTKLQLYVPGQPIKKLRDTSCIYPMNAGSTESWSTGSTQVHATFTSSLGPHQLSSSTESGLSIIFTRSKETCHGPKLFQCGEMCIDNRLLCDKISHCIKGEDEILSNCKHSSNALNPDTHTTAQPLVSTTPGEFTSDIYLWLPLIVVIVFTVVMLVLILAGRGAANCSQQRYSPTENGDLLVASLASSSTGPPTTSPSPEFGDDKVEVISITLVTVVFLSILVGCAILGFRQQRKHNQETRPTFHVKPELLVISPPTSTPTMPTTTKQPAFGGNNVDVITICLVAVVFLVILVGCAILGFQEKRHRNREQSINDGLRLESNAGFSDGGPPTPPPTYSYIERQTSYVSHISQTDSQISIPPTYEDAVDIADDPMSWHRRFRRHLSRSSSSGSSHQPRNRHRLFQRSMSAQDAPSGHGRLLSGSAARTRHASDHTAGVVANRESISSDTDSVFIETPGTPSQIQASNVSAPSALENVSEVDETLGSSQMLGPEGANNGNITLNPAVNNNTAPPPGGNEQNGGARPILARSISDVTSGNNVIFTMD